MSRFPSALPPAGVNRQQSTGSREFILLCACAAAQPTPERIATIAEWNQAPPDWDEFLRLAEHHGILPLAARNLIAHAPGLPSPIAQSLRSAYEGNVRRNLWYAAELARISEHFEVRQVRAVPYKGPVLAQSAYGDVALRNFGDLDFLISSDAFERTRLALAELEYRPSQDYSSAVERYWLRDGYERAFDGPAGKYLVEMQWRLLPRFYAVELATHDLLERAGRTVVAGQEVPCLAPEDTLLALCLHAAKHLWTRLIWVCDIAETLRTHCIDYSLACQRAREAGILRILGVSFWLAENLVGCHLPEGAEDVVHANPRVPALGEQYVARLARAATYDFESTEYFRLILHLRERWSDRWRYVWRLVWTLGMGDLQAMKLPEKLFPLYRVVRLARLMRKVIRYV